MTIIVNPASRRGRGAKLAKTVAAALDKKGIAYTISFTPAAEYAGRFAREAAASGEKLVICIGGDGTVSEVAGGLMKSETALGIIPAGTGDDFARYLGIPKDPLKALEIAISENVRAVDLGMANDRVFINAAGSGLDVAVLKHTLKYKKWLHGLPAYVLGIISAIYGYRHMELVIKHPDGEIKRKALFFTVANGQYFGGGMRVMPLADASDGLLDVQYVDELARWKIPFLLASFINGAHINWPIVHHFRCKELEATTSDSSLQLDGEILSGKTVSYKIIPAAIKIKVPALHKQDLPHI